MDDLISRKQAIDAVKSRKTAEQCSAGRMRNAVVDFCVDIIKMLPSAQPEIIRCKDCKHHWTHKCMDSMPIERCDLEQTFYDAEHDFCSLADRRED